MPKGTKLSKDTLDLDQKQWRQLRDYWTKLGYVECHGNATYKVV